METTWSGVICWDDNAGDRDCDRFDCAAVGVVDYVVKAMQAYGLDKKTWKNFSVEILGFSQKV